MKHLKLLGLLLAVMMTVFSYGQAGTGGVNVGEPFLNVSTTQLTLTGGNPASGSLAYGTLDVNVGGVETLLLQMQSGRSITLGDPEGYLVPSMSYNVNYESSVTYQVSVLLNTMTPGRYQDVLTISAPGSSLQPIQVQVFASINGGGDTTVVEPQIQLRVNNLDFQVTGELGSFQETSLFGVATNASVLHARIMGGENFLLQGPVMDSLGGFEYVQEVALPLEGGGQGSAQFNLTVMFSPTDYGTFSDVLVVWGDNSPNPVYVTLVGVMRSGSSSEAYLNVPEAVHFEGYQIPEAPITMGEVHVSVNGVQQLTATLVDGTHFGFVDFTRMGGGVAGDGGADSSSYIMVEGRPIYYSNTFTLPLMGGQAEMELPIMMLTDQLGEFVDTVVFTTAELEPRRVVVTGTVSEYVLPDTAAIGVETTYLEMKAEGGASTATAQLSGFALGVSEIHARIVHGSPFYLVSSDASAGGQSMAQEIVLPLDSSMLNPMDVYQFELNMLFSPDTFGVFMDTLWISADNTEVVPQYVVLYGEYSEMQPQQGWFYIGESMFTMSKGVTEQYTPSVWLKFHSENNDSLNIVFNEGSNFRIKLSDSDSVLYSNLTLVGDEINQHSQLQIYFTGSEIGDYVDTLWFYPSNAQPVMVVFYGFVYDNTFPEFSIWQNTLTITASLGDEMQRSISVVEAHVENIDTVRFRLSNGTHFKILDVAGYQASDSGQIVSDSDVLVTEAFMTPDLAEYSFGSRTEWKFPVVLMTNEVGEFMDTMWIEPNGVDGIFPIAVYGMVTDPNQAIVWTDNNVVVTLRNDSLIVSGTGSTSDYNEYYSGTSPWWQYIDNLSWNERPQHLVVEPGVTRLGNYAFYDLSFQTVDFGEIDTLGSYVFRNAGFDTMILPATLDYIDYQAFYSVNANVVINNMRPDVQMNGNPFANFYISYGKVIANTMQLLTISYPYTVSVESDNDSIIDLYVAYGYRYDRHEKGYDIIAHNYLMLDEDTISTLPALPTMAIDYSMYDTAYCGHVNVPISATLHLSKLLKKDYLGQTSPFTTVQRLLTWGWDSFDPGYSGVMSTLIVDGMMTADTIELREKVYPNMWHFMGLPFNQRMDEISIADHNYYCIRRFDGAIQAAGQYDSVWVDVDDDETLHAGEGFILQMTNNNYNPAEMSFKAQNDAQMQNMFTPSVQSLPLTQYPAELSWNANWNMLVNPYPSFYDTRKIANGGIITVWNRFEGEYFASYSVEDDYYVLQPHEAFLYQAAAGESALRMPLEGRQHTAVPEGVEYDPWGENGEIYRSPERTNRTLLNFYLEQNNNKDRARVVLNDQASMSYEVGVDALKMFVPGATAAQLYAEQGGAKQSILERPLGNGMVYLGVRLMEEGDCTISIPETKGMDITLLDTETGVLTDLSQGNYTFYGVPGENSQRFIVGFVGDATLLEFFANSNSDSNVVKVIENGHVFIIRGSEKFDVLGNKH